MPWNCSGRCLCSQNAAPHVQAIRLNNQKNVRRDYKNFGLVAGVLPDTMLNSIVVQEDGKLVATGVRARNNEGQDLILTRFNSDGTLDTTYGLTELRRPISAKGALLPIQAAPR